MAMEKIIIPDFMAGDSLTWEFAPGNYPDTGGWTAKTIFTEGSVNQEVIGTAQGAGWLFKLTPEDSAKFPGALYTWVIQFTNTDQRITGATGATQVYPNLEDGPAKSHAQKVVEALEAVIEGRASQDQIQMTIGGRSITRMSVDDLLKFLNYYRGKLDAELPSDKKKPKTVKARLL